MQDIFDKIQAVTGIAKISGSEIPTPQNIVKDMVDLLPSDVFNPNAKFMDPAVKSGRFLFEIYNRLMVSKSMIQAFPDKKDRRQHIMENQLYGFATSATAATIVRKQLYNNPKIAGNIQYTTEKDVVKQIQGAYINMKFDVVIGNPPYNRGMDIDFVKLGFDLSSQYTVMITPAKWQTAEANQRVASKNMDYGKFRKEIVPHMSKVVFYPDCIDVFDIRIYGGITYFLIDKNIHNTCEITNICNTQPEFAHGTVTRSLLNNEILNHMGKAIMDSIEPYIKIGKLPCVGRYQVWITDTYDSSSNGSCMFRKDGKTGVLCPSRIIDTTRESNNIGTARPIFASNSKNECESFLSWLYSKFTRFFILLAVDGFHIGANRHYYRFVPAPPSGKFDHIYTDEELYKAFNLPQKYGSITFSMW